MTLSQAASKQSLSGALRSQPNVIRASARATCYRQNAIYVTGSTGRTESGSLTSSSSQPNASVSRRSALLSLVGTSIVLARPSAVGAVEEVKLPKEYRQLVKRLSEGLSESIETEASGASEAEVRRAADPAKEVVREFVRKWRDNPRVSSDITHAEIKEALAELGEFYLAYGQRTKLTPPVRESVLRHLKAARSALPEEEGSASKVLGLF